MRVIEFTLVSSSYRQFQINTLNHFRSGEGVQTPVILIVNDPIMSVICTTNLNVDTKFQNDSTQSILDNTRKKVSGFSEQSFVHEIS